MNDRNVQGEMNMTEKGVRPRFQTLSAGWFIVVLCAACCNGAREAHAQPATTFETFCGKPVTNEAIFIAEHNLSETFETALQYAMVAQDQLLVMGRTRSNELEVGLVPATAKERDAYSVIIRYPKSDTSMMLDVSFAGVRTGGSQRDLCVIVNYTTGNVGNRVEETRTLVDLFCPDGASGYALAQREKVAEKNISWHRLSADESEYLYAAVDDSKRGPGKIEPAIRVLADVTVTDINADGDPDIIVDKQTFRSKRHDDAVASDFVFVRQEMVAMPYQRTQRRFLGPAIIRDPSLVVDAMKKGVPLFQKRRKPKRE